MITKDTILELLERAEHPAVSVFLPTHRKGEEVQQDPIRFKNQLREAKQQLERMGLSSSEAEEFLEPALDLLDKPLFWQHGERGLAVFMTNNFFKTWKMPLDFREQVYAGDRFLITPLLPMITLEGTFCILALSQKNMRLLKATRESYEPLSLDDAPTSMEEFKQYDLEEKSLSPAPGGGDKPMYHGWGDASVEDNYVENYLKQVENEVTSILRQRNDPLVLTGVNKAIALYRKVNHYHRLMDDAMPGNPDEKSEEELRKEGWEVIKSYFLKDMYHDLSRYNDLKGTGKQSDDLSQIVQSSHYGKVDTLFLGTGQQRWGRFEPEEDTVHLSSGRSDGDYDLLNEAAIRTLTQGGDVYSLDREDMPDGVSAAAIYRY